ncbi:MAG TPA: GNAT family N-acetyltransferase [Dongiaceae bacterium]|jgi:GNAT superfamily N-acetyltransferase
MTFAVRPAIADDAGAIAEIHYAGWQVAYADIITTEDMASRLPERRVAFWQERIADLGDLVLIAEDERGAAQGFMHGGRVLEHDIRAGSLDGYDCEIYSLHCRQRVHGQGLGRLLMAETARVFRERGCRALTLWAFRDNSYRVFYERNGGTLIAEGFDGDIPDVAYGWPVVALAGSQTGAA